MSEFQPGRQDAPQISTQDAPRPSRRSALLLWVFAGAGAVLIEGSALFITVDSELAEVVLTLLFNLLYYFAFLILPVVVLAKRRPGLWRSYRPYPISPFSAISIVALALLGVFFFTDLSALWSVLLEALGLVNLGTDFLVPDDTAGLIIIVFHSAVLPAVCEEFSMRGAILPGLESGGTKRAVLLSAVLFALLHGSIVGLPMQFLVGLILAWLVVYCDSIYAGLIYHTTHNAATILLEFALNRHAILSGEELPEYERMIDAVGGRSGLIQLVVELAMLGLLMLISLRMFRMRARLRGVEIVPKQRWERLRASEWALLAIGIIIVIARYAADLQTMLPGGWT